MKLSVEEFYTANRYYPDTKLIRGNVILCPTCEKKEANCYRVGGVYSIGNCTRCEAKKQEKFKDVPHLGGLPEFTSEKIKEGRREYFNSMVQTFRDGTPSREFYEARPQEAKKIFKDDVKRMQYVWKDVQGWNNREKSK